MKYVLGGLALIAAVIIVGCSATTLFLTAFNSVNEPWQQWLQGAGIASIVAWEAAAVLIIGYCFKTRHWATGAGAVLLLVLAMAVTSRQELRLYLGGQADVTASRTVTADDRSRVRAELDRAYDRRDTLQAKDKLTKSQEADLTDVKARIKALEDRWDTQTIDVRASGHAEGDFARKLFGFDADLAQMFLDTLPLWFWMVARVFSISAAVAAIRAMWHESAKEARPRPEDDLGVIVVRGTVTAPPAPAPRVERRPLDGTLEKLTGAKAATRSENEHVVADVLAKSPIVDVEPDGDGTPAPTPDIEPAEEPDDTRKVVNLFPNDSTPPEAPRGRKGHKPEAKGEAWLAACTSQTDSTRDQVSSAECWKSYLAYCDAIDRKPLHRKQFSQQIGVLLGRKSGKSRKRDKHGVIFTGLMINPIVAQRRVRAA